jgi:signal transduction histidine kinase
MSITYAHINNGHRWHGSPLHPTLLAQFAPRSILSVVVATDDLRGRLFFFDKVRPSLDDLALVEVAAGHIASRLARLSVEQRSRRETGLAERRRLACDLHDGALQSLAGLSLELESLLRTDTFDGPTTRARIADIQQSLREEQRNIREVITKLRKAPPAKTERGLAERLEGLARRLKRQWGLQVECALHGLETLPPGRSNEIYLLVREALVNAARHGNAAHARFDVTVSDGRVSIIVADDGIGLGLNGRWDGPALAKANLGPVTIRERVGLLGGTLTIACPGSGTRLEITLLAEHACAA